MTEEQKELWASALESGRYIQGHSCLKRVDEDGVTTHCCLGVAAEVFGALDIDEDPVLADERKFEFTMSDGQTRCRSSAPPDGWMGLNVSQNREFMRMNDLEHKTFAQIAMVVRKLPATE